MCSQQYLVVREWCEALWIRGCKNIMLESSHCSGHEHAAAIPLSQIQSLYRDTDDESQHRLQDARISSIGSELTPKGMLVAAGPHSLHPFLPPAVQSESLSIACTVKPPLSSKSYKKRHPISSTWVLIPLLRFLLWCLSPELGSELWTLLTACFLPILSSVRGVNNSSIKLLNPTICLNSFIQDLSNISHETYFHTTQKESLSACYI